MSPSGVRLTGENGVRYTVPQYLSPEDMSDILAVRFRVADVYKNRSVAVYFDGAVRICSGSVYSFYQFEQPISDRLTDDEWRDMVNDWNNPPQKADWTQPLYAE